MMIITIYTKKEQLRMRRKQRKSFAELVKENKSELLRNPAAMREIEERLEERLEIKRSAK